jgi:hypothetical protein
LIISFLRALRLKIFQYWEVFVIHEIQEAIS